MEKEIFSSVWTAVYTSEWYWTCSMTQALISRVFTSQGRALIHVTIELDAISGDSVSFSLPLFLRSWISFQNENSCEFCQYDRPWSQNNQLFEAQLRFFFVYSIPQPIQPINFSQSRKKTLHCFSPIIFARASTWPPTKLSFAYTTHSIFCNQSIFPTSLMKMLLC